MAEPSQSKVIIIPERFTAGQRNQIGADIIEFIKRRTQSGLDVEGNLFSGYSKNYDKSGLVDLTVSEQMLNSLTVLSHGQGFIRIGFRVSSANNKAAWIQSPYGKKLGKQSPREFVGISASDLETILLRYS